MNAFQHKLEAQRTPRRAARLIACLVIGLVLPGQISSLFGQHITTIIHDVSAMADGSIAHARLEAQRQVASGNLAYRSYGKEGSRTFSGKYAPPELPEEMKGRFVYGLALFSDDGCNVKVNGSMVHERLGKGQHLPNIGESFHVLQTALAPGEPIDITVDYSNIIYDDDSDSADYPDIDGCTLFLYLIPAGIAVDANRDGTIAFSGDSRDTTSQHAPFRFWINDDNDGLPGAEGDVIDAPSPDYKDGIIQTARDLEDFTRLHLFIDAFHEELADGKLKIGLKFKDVEGADPKINVYKSTDSEGSDSYLKNDKDASAQLAAKNAAALGEATERSTMFLPQDFWIGSNASSKKCLLFEAAGEGKGKLVMTINKSDGTEIGEGTGVLLYLKNVKKMYVRGEGYFTHYGSPFSLNPQSIQTANRDFDGIPYEPDVQEEDKAIIFVHGIHGPGEDDPNKIRKAWYLTSETIFKRLWQQGFRGLFASYKWAALTPGPQGWPLDYAPFAFNESEFRSWKLGHALAAFINGMPKRRKSVMAHSQGNVISGYALSHGNATVENYALMQAAIPAGCFDERDDPINNYQLFRSAEAQVARTPDYADDLGYRSYIRSINVTRRVVNFHNKDDYALVTGTVAGFSTNWEGNQTLYKPNRNVGTLGRLTYSYDSGPRNNRYPIGQRCFLRRSYPPFIQRQLTDIRESMSFVARPRSQAAGALGATRGSITDDVNLNSPPYSFGTSPSDHGGQFDRSIQKAWDVYTVLMGVFGDE
jgi:hypothetical protein